MKSILVITTVPETIRAFLLPYAKHFRSQGWRVDAMACGVSSSPECFETYDCVWDVQWSRNPLDLRNLIGTPHIIKKAVEKQKYDIVHVHTPVAAFVSRYALRNLKKQSKPKIIYTAHGLHFHSGSTRLKNSVFSTIEKIAGKWTDYLVVMNKEDEEAAKRQRLVSPEKVRYMPGIGLDLKYYSPEAVCDSEVKGVRQELGLAPTTSLLLSVAEFIPRKRPQDVLKAFASLSRADICLAFAGDGPLLKAMRQLATDLGVQNQVIFLGVRKDIPTLMRASVATILASEQEGLPRCVMESMCMETPVIGTSIRGTQDLLAEGSGLLVKVGDVEGLANAMTYLLDHPQEAQTMAKRARKRIAFYDLHHIIELHESLYTEVLSQFD